MECSDRRREGPSEQPGPTDRQPFDKTAERNTAPERQRSKFQLIAIVVAIYQTAFITGLDQTIVATCLPAIAQDLNASSSYAWIGSVYLLSSAVAMSLLSNWSEIWGRKVLILIAIAIFFFSSIFCALSQSISMLIAARVLQGFGGGGSAVLVGIVICDIFSMRTRTRVFALMEIVMTAAAGAGPVLGGVIVEKIGWRWVFWINLPVSGLAFVLIAFFLDVHNPRTQLREGLGAIDWFGGISIIGLAVMILLGLNFGGAEYPWNSSIVICLFAFGALMFALFILSEKHVAKYPILPLRVFADKSNIAALLGSIMQNMVLMISEYYLPLYFQSAKGASTTTSGILLIPYGVSEALSSLLAGMMMSWSGRYLHIMWIANALMTLGTGLLVDFDVNSSFPKIILFQIVAGFGVGGLFSAPLIAIQARVAQEDHAAAIAALNLARGLAGSLAIVIGGAVFQSGMKKQDAPLLAAGLPVDVATAVTGGDAVAHVPLLKEITDPLQLLAARTAYATCLQNLWILATALAGVSLASVFFLQKSALSSEHVETKTGLRSKQHEERPGQIELTG